MRSRHDVDDRWRMSEAAADRYGGDRRDDQRRGGDPHEGRDGEAWSRHGYNDVRNPFLPLAVCSERCLVACIQRSFSQDAMGWTPNHRHNDRPGGFNRGGSSRYDNGDWRDERRDGDVREWTRDNGWESRKQSSAAQSWDEPSKAWGSGRGESSNREDRSWEPSASWKPGRRDAGASSASTQRGQNGGKSKGKNKGNKKGSNKQQQQQKRSWRDDDSQLNKCVGFM